MTSSCFWTGVFGTLAVIIFGANGRSYEWTSDEQHNYLSWSYGLGKCCRWDLIDVDNHYRAAK